jgi:hypothetical protein
VVVNQKPGFQGFAFAKWVHTLYRYVPGEIPDAKGAPKLAAVTDLEELEDVVDAYEERCEEIQDCEAQAAKLETMLAGMGDAVGHSDADGADVCAAWSDGCAAWATLFDDPAEAEALVTDKVNACRTNLTVHAAALLKSLPYRSFEETQSALDEARERLEVGLYKFANPVDP